ncbi:phosphatidylcholine and lysophosphatidylcholine phospholipase [Coemansia sp. RSA 2322]|nr:phosphatidylcholine and lysophosphatidylcholine phospholipase [Coemansia sp. RSA 2322]
MPVFSGGLRIRLSAVNVGLAVLLVVVVVVSSVAPHQHNAAGGLALVGERLMCDNNIKSSDAMCEVRDGGRLGGGDAGSGSLAPEQNVVVRVARAVTWLLGTTLFWMMMAVGIVVVNMVLPLARGTVQALLYYATPLRSAVVLGGLGGVAGLYYFRYYYAGPKKSAGSGKGGGKEGGQGGAAGFDLHPDGAAAHNSEDSDGGRYVGLAEARGGVRQRRQAAEGGGAFPADFLKMFMKSISIFGYIDEPVFHEFSRQLQTRRVLAGERMFGTDDDRDDQSFYVVIDGQVQVYLTDGPGLDSEAGAGAGAFGSDGAGAFGSDGAGPSLGDSAEASAAILLNSVGPGEVLSSMFSILALFTGGREAGAAEGQGRPNIVARATADTTLAMIPGSAFRRVTRLYPKAAAHILQVLLARVQRVTFGTVCEYLDLPNELVPIERAMGALARRELSAALASSGALRQIAGAGAGRGSFSAGSGLTAAAVPAARVGSSQRHRRAGSDGVQAGGGGVPDGGDGVPDGVPAGEDASALPSGEAIDALRRDALAQVCASLGLDAGRPHALLASEVDVYHVPDGCALAEQGRRPAGLFVVLHGAVEITHRPRGAGATAAAAAAGRDCAISDMCRRMTQLAARGGEPQRAAEARARVDRQRRAEPLTYEARAGDVVAYLAALTDMASLHTARSRGAVVAFVSRWAVGRLGERHPEVLATLARRLAARLPAAMASVDYAVEWVQVAAGQTVCRQGAASDAALVVLAGRLRACAERAGGAVATVAEYGQGQAVGEPNLLLREPSRFSLHAIRDSELVRIPAALVRALVHAAPRLAFHLSRTLAERAAQSLWLRRPLDAAPAATANLKSIAVIPVSADVPVRAFAELLEAALATTAGAGPVALLDHTAASRVLGRHAFSRIARLKTAAWIAELEQRCRLLLHVADGGLASPWTRHCMRHADFVLLVALADADPAVAGFERLLLALKTTARTELVLLHEARAGLATGSTREWLAPRPWVHAHHHMQMPLAYGDFSAKDPPSANIAPQPHSTSWLRSVTLLLAPTSFLPPSARAIGIARIRTSLGRYYRRLVRAPQPTPATCQGHRSDFARLARHLCGRSIGLVLGGGGARGIALLGVLRAFEEAGIPVDMVGGTSIGAFMSGLYAQSPDSVAIHGPVRAFSRRMSSMWRFLLDVTYPILAYTSGREFNRTIWKVFKDAEIEDLWLPFFCMTANITRSRPEAHTRGLLWRVVRASMSLGGLVPPLCDENGDLLVDGGYLDNLPVRVMKNELGASMIFAVNIAAENDTSPVRYGASVSGFWVLLNHLNPLRSYWIPTLSEVQSRLTYASSDKELESAKIADSCVYLRVPPRDVGVLDFGRFDELYRRGYEQSKAWTARWQQAGLLDQWQAVSPAHSASVNTDAFAVRGGFSSSDDAASGPPPTCPLVRRNSI